MRPPLADQLVTKAAGAIFARALHVVRQVLPEVLAIPAQLHKPLLSFFKHAAELVCRAGVSHPARHLLTGSEGCKVVAADESVDAVDGVIVGVPLIVAQRAVRTASGGCRISCDQILDSPLYSRPVALEKTIVRRVKRLP